MRWWVFVTAVLMLSLGMWAVDPVAAGGNETEAGAMSPHTEGMVRTRSQGSEISKEPPGEVTPPAYAVSAMNSNPERSEGDSRETGEAFESGYRGKGFRNLYEWRNSARFLEDRGSWKLAGGEQLRFLRVLGWWNSAQPAAKQWVGLGNYESRSLLFHTDGRFFAGAGLDGEAGGVSVRSEEWSYVPRIFLTAGMRTEVFTVQPHLSLWGAGTDSISDLDSVIQGYVLEVPFSIRHGMLGATVSGVWGYTAGDGTGRISSSMEEGFGLSGKATGDLDSDPHRAVHWGGYVDISFGGKPLAIHVAGGVRQEGNELWNNEQARVRWGALLRVPFSPVDSLTVSPELGYSSMSEDSRTNQAPVKEPSEEWAAGIQFRFAF